MKSVVYADGQSSYSPNAQAAFTQGKDVITRIARQFALPTAVLREICEPCEWHHVSKYANAIYFYDPDDVVFALLFEAHDVRRHYFHHPKGVKRKAVYEFLLKEAREWLRLKRKWRHEKNIVRPARS